MKHIAVGLVCFIFIAEVYAESCPSACTWVGWESWGTCSSNCGGGYQNRTRQACCRSYATFDQCMVECHLRSSDAREKRCCNTDCKHGGTWTFLDRQSCNGRCKCPKGYQGNCCQTACPYITNCLPNETECNFLGSRCLKCKPPYISTGWTGTCRHPICMPKCENNGTCISDGVCDCAAGYIGETCSLGGSIDSYLLPSLHAVEDAPFRPLSWYDSPSFSEFGRVCYIKIEIQGAPVETLVTAESLSLSGKKFGDFTTGPIDSNGRLNETSRTACLQIRCPSNAKEGEYHSIAVKVFPITRAGRCTAHETSNHMNTTVQSDPKSHDLVTLQADSGNNYGPAYGLYIGMGTRENAIFVARQQCLSGTNFNIYDINTSKGVMATYTC